MWAFGEQRVECMALSRGPCEPVPVPLGIEAGAGWSLPIEEAHVASCEPFMVIVWQTMEPCDPMVEGWGHEGEPRQCEGVTPTHTQPEWLRALRTRVA